MDSYDFGRLIYLVLLATVIVGYFLVENRNRLGKTAQQAVIWGLLFLGVVAGYGLWDDIARDVTGRGTVAADGTIEVPMAPDGHYYLSADVNGERVRFVVDTGASDIVLTQYDAERLGFDADALAYTGMAQTANGMVETAPVMLGLVELAGFRDESVRAVVNRGDLETSLLGMSYLENFHLTLSGDLMTLSR